MDNMPLIALIFQSIPEAIILITLGLALVGSYPRMRIIVIVGILGAIFSYFCRRLPLVFGVHVFVEMFVVYILVVTIVRLEFIRGAVAVLLGMLSVGIVEMISIPLITSITGISFKAALSDPLLRILFPIPEEIILGIAAYYCRKRRITLFKNDKISIDSSEEEK